MLPLGHAAGAYLAYVGAAAITARRLPARLSLVPLVFASQLPDLIDKPLAYYGVLPSGRAFGHSLLTFALLTAAVVAAARARDRLTHPTLRRLLALSPLPFAIGYATHLLGDAYRALLAGQFRGASYLVWPLLPAPRYPSDGIAPWVRAVRLTRSSTTHDQFVLVLLAVAVFVALRVRAYWRRRADATD